MEVEVKESTIVRPAEETPKHCLPTSDLDLLARPVHVPIVYFYRRPNDCSNFFEAALLKEALSKVLVPFYPVAGRFGRDENGRIQINCNGDGALFVEAETRCAIDDLGDFTQNLLWLHPRVDYTKDMSSYPILVTQVTRFKCGGVSLGFALHHTFADGTSVFHFINAWAEMARGFPISIPPFFDRTLLDVGVPASPTFHHIEYDPPPTLNIPSQSTEFQSNPNSISTSILKLSPDQVNTLKTMLKKDLGSDIKYSGFEILTAHIWRCLCKARGLSDDQASKLHIPTSARSRLNPPLPSGYVGNVIFNATPVALSGDIQSEPLKNTVERIHKAIKRMDDEYLKSALAYLKQQQDLTVLRKGSRNMNCPNLNVSNISRISFFDADFGWGRAIFVRPTPLVDGVIHILPSPNNDESLYVAINLETHHLRLFNKLFYEIFVQSEIVRSRY
ncbi:Hydroxycinnamoyl-CoA shikimate/quinate hydroxycinnamoyl transferase [Melia azedarach]|uniref:Hydroxycinnamoyl-CoA shikimate/quinate hydroxycinnamoyl transferase n=1 Tax=Melia azedarach TaxID=155640 RepID=A0ACC1XE30_MELAZ|nr:Hydroxycinnamoyl-CoA shikimate/quinate hydroxycinnamoyl transferase [Melia azedarach]